MTRTALFGLIVCGLTAAVCAGAAEATDPPLEPKPYRIGIAPSHITTPTGPLFGERAGEWKEVRGAIDFYKVYSLQPVPPKWATALDVNAFSAFVKEHGIAVDAEFGAFGLNNGVEEGKAAAERARTMHDWLGHRGLRLRALHLDGPMTRMLAREGKQGCSLSLEQVAAEMAVFFAECRAAFPGTKIGLITNFPNWHYTPEHPGMLGGWTNSHGIHYHDALEAVFEAARARGVGFDFVEVDCPWNYYRATANRFEPERRVDNAAKFKALQQWCKERGLEFWLVVNYDTNPQQVAGQGELGNKLFHDNTLTYIRRLRRDGVFPDCFTIQSWYKLPDQHLPEEGGFSFMHTARDAIRLIRELYPQAAPTDPVAFIHGELAMPVSAQRIRLGPLTMIYDAPETPVRYDGSLSTWRRDGEMYFFHSFGCRNNRISSHTWHKGTIDTLFEVKISDILQFYKDGIPFCAPQHFGVQKQGRALYAVNIATNGGDTHWFFDRIKGTFRAKDLRLRFEFIGIGKDAKIRIIDKEARIAEVVSGELTFRIHVPVALFDGNEIEMKMGRPLKDRKTLDLVLHAGGEKIFDLRGFTDTVVGIALAVDTGTETTSFANLESTLDNHRLTLDWGSLHLSIPTQPAPEIALQKSFKASVDGESRK